MLLVFRRKDLCEAKHDVGFGKLCAEILCQKSTLVSNGLAIWRGVVNGLKVKWGTSSDI